MRTCAYRNCDTDLDQLPQRPKSTARFCSDAHRVAEHRAAKVVLERIADSHSPAGFWAGVRNIVRGPNARRTRP